MLTKRCVWDLDHEPKGAKCPSAEWSKSPETPLGQHSTVIDPSDFIANQFCYSSSWPLRICEHCYYCTIDHRCEHTHDYKPRGHAIYQYCALP